MNVARLGAQDLQAYRALMLHAYGDIRGKGAGRALMAAALEHCRARPGLGVPQLTVTQGNEPAISLYRSFGFREFGLEPKAIRGPSGYLAKVHMWLDLE